MVKRLLEPGPWPIAAALLLFVGLTNYWAGWRETIRYVNQTDAYSYEAIANAAPSLPVEPIFALHAQRFSLHWLTGELGELPGVGVHPAYYVVLAGLVALLLVVFHLLLSRYELSRVAYGVCMGLLVCSPFALRPYAVTPALFQDVAFVLGISKMLLGLTRRSLAVVLAGVVVAAITRQSALLVAAAVAVWILGAGGWREFSVSRRLVACAGVVAAAVGLYAISSAISRPFSSELPSMGIPEDTVQSLLVDPDQFKALATHTLRTGLPLLMPCAVLVARQRLPTGVCRSDRSHASAVR